MGEVVPANLHNQLRYPTRSRVHVPMAEQEARSNRFVHQLAEPMEMPKPSPSSNKVLRSLLGECLEAYHQAVAEAEDSLLGDPAEGQDFLGLRSVLPNP